MNQVKLTGLMTKWDFEIKEGMGAGRFVSLIACENHCVLFLSFDKCTDPFIEKARQRSREQDGPKQDILYVSGYLEQWGHINVIIVEKFVNLSMLPIQTSQLNFIALQDMCDEYKTNVLVFDTKVGKRYLVKEREVWKIKEVDEEGIVIKQDVGEIYGQANWLCFMDAKLDVEKTKFLGGYVK